MPELLHPGVYVLEIPSGVRPIEGVSTSTAAFIGMTDKGSLPGTLLPNGKVARPVLVTSFTDYVRQFGGFRLDSFLTYAVQAFFNNGGSRLYIVRAANGATPPLRSMVGLDSVAVTTTSAQVQLNAFQPGAWSNLLSVAIGSASGGNENNLDLIVSARTGVNTLVEVERLSDLPFATAKTVINTTSKFVRPDAPTTAFPARPVNTGWLSRTTPGAIGAGTWTPSTVTTTNPNGIVVNSLHPGSWADELVAVQILPASNLDAQQFDLQVSLNGVPVERFLNLVAKSAVAADPIPPNYARSVINDPVSGSRYITLPNDFTTRPTDSAGSENLDDGGNGTGTRSAWGPTSILMVTAANEGRWGNDLSIRIADATEGDPQRFLLAVNYGPSPVETFDNLQVAKTTTTDPLPPDYAATIVNSRSEYIHIRINDRITERPPNGTVALAHGDDGVVPAASDYIGLPATTSDRTGTGLFALDKVTDVNLIAIPGQGDPQVVNAGMAYCKIGRDLQDCFFIGDSGTIDDVADARLDGAQPTVRTVADARDFATTGFGGVALDKAAGDFGAIYYPWVWSADPIGSGRNPRILLPPSGFIAGLYARIDNSRGVFKAPAGTEAGIVGALAPATTVSDAEQDQLNPIKVNVIRIVPGSGLVSWGTRTIGSDPEWRYIPVRRMAIFIRASIYYGIQWAVFEPNDEPLWASLRLNIRSFMLTQFRAGAFQGRTPEDAFFVRCGSDTTTQTDIDNGVVNILVGFAPLKPAEFVVLRLQQKVNQPV
ncbi:MAG: putative phage tail sheath protein [Thermomicrobiales bacterium]|jgi:phage tail sheath protein FI|nr:putative phage tail sheath protein [Thermomicrobiales bacterium]MDF2757675.1 putative phage tail sheath protein [Thermomicrobiales bacterium]